jgi:hypothetical protein
VAGEEIGMDVRFDDPLDLQSVFSSFGQVHVDIAPRVYDNRPSGALIPDEIRPLRQAIQVVLREDHRFRSPGRRDNVVPPLSRIFVRLAASAGTRVAPITVAVIAI